MPLERFTLLAADSFNQWQSYSYLQLFTRKSLPPLESFQALESNEKRQQNGRTKSLSASLKSALKTFFFKVSFKVSNANFLLKSFQQV